MSLLADTVERILRAERDGLWPALEASGLTTIGVPEHCGGSGGSAADAATVMGLCAQHAAPVPVAETGWLAGWLLARAGQSLTSGMWTAAAGDVRFEGGRLSGVLPRVPWARQATGLVVAGDGRIYRVDPAQCEISPGENLAGEPRDTVVLGAVPATPVAAEVTPHDLRQRGALARAIQIAGAARQVLDGTVSYVTQRSQFGRPIGAFQAVQQLLAELAGEVCLMDVSTLAAVEACGTPGSAVAVAAVKANASRGAGVVARIAHQLHGAMGTTKEHHLPLLTTRLWSWREEYGNEAYWNGQLAAMERDDWPLITGV